MNALKGLGWLICCLLLICLLSCSTEQEKRGFVRVEDGRFVIDGQPYRFIGTNFWYGTLLASDGQGGNRARLAAELDTLHSLGIDNLRILVGADGATQHPHLVWPTLQKAPGVYNDSVLAGLDWLLKEMSARGMKAVLYLNNSWEWSGGYGQYLEWAGEGKAPDPSDDGYKAYTDFVRRFAVNTEAQQLFKQHVKNIIERTNRYTGVRYTDDSTVMAWQIGNEPRAFADDALSIDGFLNWIAETAALIKQIDPNHMVSVGSEGMVGCEMQLPLYEKMHADPNIDYLTIHIWPMNWGWVSRDEIRCDSSGSDTITLNRVKTLTDNYVHKHIDVAQRLGKPLVIEEFGYARDGLQFDLASTTHARDAYYEYLLSAIQTNPIVSGVNFWSWSGFAQPKHVIWQPFDDYCGDPAQEEQGLYSVFLSDSSTIQLLKSITSRQSNVF